MNIPTPHLSMKSKDEVAGTVLMPGDPLRAKFIAENFLSGSREINSVRNALAYTGTYKGRKISVVSSGMGMPSIGIYSFELYNFYGVENIIRIGSCGAYAPELNLYDVLLVEDVWSESSFARVQSGFEGDVLAASPALNEKLAGFADELNIPIRRCRVHSSDVFYRQNFEEYKQIHREHGCLAAEMEAFGLFANAMSSNKQAACLLTVSDSLAKGEETTSEERQNAFTKMMQIALEMAD